MYSLLWAIISFHCKFFISSSFVSYFNPFQPLIYQVMLILSLLDIGHCSSKFFSQGWVYSTVAVIAFLYIPHKPLFFDSAFQKRCNSNSIVSQFIMPANCQLSLVAAISQLCCFIVSYSFQLLTFTSRSFLVSLPSPLNIFFFAFSQDIV